MEEGGRRTVRAGKDKPAALAYQLLDETLLLISTHSNDKCDQLRQRLINSRRGGGGDHWSKTPNPSLPPGRTSVKEEV